MKVGQGVFFADGHFIQSNAQDVFVPAIDSITGGYRDFDKPSNSLGYSITREYVSSDQDASLRDPSFGFNNYNAPGADRYKLSLSPKQIEFDGLTGSAAGLTFNTENYFEVVRVVNGETTKATLFSNYADLEEALARRTFDESGHYTVRPFSLSFGEHSAVFGTVDTSKFGAVIGPGKAYIRGYEFETVTSSYLSLTKSRSLGLLRNLTCPSTPENMVKVDCSRDHHLGSGQDFNDNQTAFALTENLLVGLFKADDPTATNPNFTLIGTAFLRTVQSSFHAPDGDLAFVGLSNVKMLGVNGSSTNSRRNFNSDTDLIRTLDENEFAEAAVGGTNNPNNTCYFRTLKNDDGTLIFKNREGRGAGDANLVFPLLTGENAQARIQTLSSSPNAPFNSAEDVQSGLSTRTAHSVFLPIRFVAGSKTSEPVELPDNSASFIPSQSNAYTLFIPRKDNDGNGPATAYAGNRLVPPNEYSVTVNQSTGSLRVEIGSNDNIRDTGSQEIYGVINATVFRDSIPNDHTHNIRTLSLNNNVMSAFDQTRSISGVTLAVTNLDAETLYPNLFN